MTFCNRAASNCSLIEKAIQMSHFGHRIDFKNRSLVRFRYTPVLRYTIQIL